MAINRLTNAMRSSILDDLILYGFKDKMQAQYDAELTFVKKVWDDVFSKQQEAIDAAPSSWFKTQYSFKVGFDNVISELSFQHGFSANYREAWSNFGVNTDGANKVRMPHSATTYIPVKNYLAKSSMGKQLAALGDISDDLFAEVKTTKIATEVALSRISTISKLIDAWPECASFVEPYRVMGEKEALLPMVSREALNVTLGLPPKINHVAGGCVVA
jgi:hypothetical protein